MNFVAHTGDGSVNLQATLSASSATGTVVTPVDPHHPITCGSELRLADDGTFSCRHSEVPAGDTRTQLCIDHSVALLLIELSHEL
jgi:hypothetical protein